MPETNLWFNIFMYVIIGLFGLTIGSFLNVCIYRIPEKQSISFPPSHCMSCDHKLSFWDLFPLFSYIFLGGKCRYCKAKISPQYPIVEALNCIVYLILFHHFDLQITFVFYAILSSIMIVLAFIDMKYMLLPDKIVVIAAILGLVYTLIPESILLPQYNLNIAQESVRFAPNLVLPEYCAGLGIVSNSYLDRIIDAVLGLIAGGGLFWLIAIITKGNMGGGDIKFMGALGLWFGLKGIAMISFLAFIIGSIISLIIVRMKKGNMKSAVPFGPFIIIAAFVTILFYAPILELYLKMAGFN